MSEVVLACSAGGHLLQLLALREAWAGRDVLWVTDDTSDARSLLAGERVVYAHWPTARNARTAAKNLRLAWEVIGRERPRVLVTTGAGTAVPFAWVARLRGARLVYVESLTRIEQPSLSLRLLAPFADRVYVQWPELARRVRRARFAGTVIGG
jgi:UDP-N-acetylglucosamine:LPS N-acetylglucosamine transferase